MKNSSDSPSWLLSMTSLFPVKVGSEDMLGEGLGGGAGGVINFRNVLVQGVGVGSLFCSVVTTDCFVGGLVLDVYLHKVSRLSACQSVSLACMPVCLSACLSFCLCTFMSALYIKKIKIQRNGFQQELGRERREVEGGGGNGI